MMYLLDTNVVIRLIGGDRPMTRRVSQYSRSDFGLPVMVVHELYFGAFKSRRMEQNIRYLQAVDFDVLDFQSTDARMAGEIRAMLAARGTPIGPFDLLIAAQAVARNLILITHNTREFSRVPDLRIEDWEA